MSFLLKFFSSRKPDIRGLLKDGAIVVDARSTGEYSSGHATESRNIPLPSLQSKIASLKKQRNVIITCCASGMRSGRAAKMLRKAGVEAHNGGAWQNVERLQKPVNEPTR